MRRERGMLYTLWDIETNNLVAEYDSRHDALGLVLSGIARNGPQDTDTLALEVEDDEGNVTSVAFGQALAELARREFRAMPLAGK
jgi:hypothetical protein